MAPPSTKITPRSKGASAGESDSRPTRSSARVAIHAEDEGMRSEKPVSDVGKGKKRAAPSSEGTEKRVTRRRVSQAEEGSSQAPTAPRRNKSRASKGGEGEDTVAQPSVRSKGRKGRAVGVTRFWRNNSSIAGTSSQAPSNKKDFMSSGMYCQDPNPNSPRKLVNRVLSRRAAEIKAARKKGKAAQAAQSLGPDAERVIFPPMPYDYGDKLFFETEHEFVLPYEIQWAAQNGSLDTSKRPEPFQRIRQNAFPERTKVSSGITAICRCTPESGCNEDCDNRIMHYTCGKDCPAGDNCNNKSLWKRKQPAFKVAYTAARGFGLFAAEDIKEGDFVIDYRGEIIAMSTFYERCHAEYATSKNYYALAYDQDEVIDAASRGNEARFINHGCQSNLEVRKVSTLGEGVEEYEVGMWAARDINAGEELCYDYNFDSFAAATATECQCGAPNCIGYLGRNPGDKSLKEQKLEVELDEMSKKATKKQVKRAVKSAVKKASVKSKPVTPPKAAKVGKGRSRVSAAALERIKRMKMRALREMQAVREMEVEANLAVQAAQAAVVDQFEGMPPPFLATLDDSSNPASQSVPTPAKRGRKPKNPADPNAPSSSRKGRKPATLNDGVETIVDEEEEAARKEEARKRRISGWADWLKKKASEKSRTKEEWLEFANKRRRGKLWMEGMMQTYGVAVYEGGPAEPYVSPVTDIPATGQPKRRGPPPGTPRAPRAPKAEEPIGPRVFDPLIDAPTDPSLTGESDAERALRSIYPDFALASEIPNISGNAQPIAGPSTLPATLADPVASEPTGEDFDATAVDFDSIAVEELFGDQQSVDYFETQQRYGLGTNATRTNGNQLSQQSNARTESAAIPIQPYSLAQIQQAVEAEEALGYQTTDEQNEELRQRAIAIVSSIQPQMPGQ